MSSRIVWAAAAFAVVLTASGCDSGSDPATTGSDAPSSPASSSPASTSPATSPTTAPRLIRYAKGGSVGVEVTNRAQASRLRGAPADFKQFIGETAEKLSQGTTCEGAYVGVTVELLRTDGYALGGVNDCGGYAALWAVVDGSWKEIGGTQDMWGCRRLERYQVPSDVAGKKCYDATAKKVRAYHQA